VLHVNLHGGGGERAASRDKLWQRGPTVSGKRAPVRGYMSADHGYSCHSISLPNPAHRHGTKEVPRGQDRSPPTQPFGLQAAAATKTDCEPDDTLRVVGLAWRAWRTWCLMAGLLRSRVRDMGATARVER